MPISNPITYQESGINLGSLVMTQGTRSRSLSNPVKMQDAALLNQRPVRISVSSTEITVWVRGEEIYHVERDPLMSSREWNQKIDHLRHDYVASMLQDTTDADLRSRGINTNLTPDKISEDGRTVLELATTISTRLTKLEEDYQAKLLSYRDMCNSNGLRLTILCVSSTHVYTNCHMRVDHVSEYCRRLREAKAFELEIANQTGRVPNQDSDEGLRGVKEVKDMMDSLAQLTKKSAWDFNEQLQGISLEDCSEADTREASRIMNKTWKEAAKAISKKPDSALDDYAKSLRSKETRADMKRIIPFPCVLPSYTGKQALAVDFLSLAENTDLPEDAYPIAHLFKSGINNARVEQDMMPESSQKLTSLSEALGGVNLPKAGKNRRILSFEDDLTEQENDRIALSGVGSKLRKEMEEIKEHEKHQKKSFDLSSPTADIEDFLDSDILCDHDSNMRMKNPAMNLVESSQKKENKHKASRKLFEWTTDIGITRYGHFLSELCLELSYEYKVPHKVKQWTCKPMRNYDVMILLKNTGTHVFFSLAGKVADSSLWDTGRLGPEIFESNGYWFSDFCSVVEATLEHFLKSGPYLGSLSTYLMQHFKIPFLTRKIVVPQEFWRTFKCLFLIYMNNKSDLENLILDCRFLYMKIMQKHERDPYMFIERLPSVLRSRLTVYFLKRVMGLMKRYRSNPPGQVRIRKLPDSDPNSVRITGLRCIFHDAPIQLEQLIDTFYFGYTISKMKGKVGDRSLKIVTKIIKEEMWARDHIKEVKNALWSDALEPERQHWSASLMKKMIDLLKGKWKLLHGENFVQALNNKIAADFWSREFSDIATLKASSKDFENPEINLPENKEGALQGKDYVKALKEANPKLKGKRPRVITALIKVIKQYAQETNDWNPTLIKMLPYCLEKLLKRGFIYSDCFPKDQHGGDREIHVLEIKARIVQYFIERCAVCMSYLFNSDTVLNPKRKETFMRDHEMFAQAQLGNHMTLCKSADATKWAQRHHVSKFYFVMNRMTEGAFDGLLYNAFYLWTVKRVAIPEDLVSILDASHFSESDNVVLQWLRCKFKEGSLPFVGKNCNSIEVKYGMFQGIFHRVSSVVHSICQEFYASVVRQKAHESRMSLVVTVVQGSDDSACCISFAEDSPSRQAFVHILLKWKEEFQKYISIWPSEAKSSIGTQLFVEYNSEWWFRGKVLKPTFRWVSACLETSIVETFYNRMQLFYDGLTTAVEVGLSTLAASVIQKNQALLHYLMMGFYNHTLRHEMKNLFLTVPHPSLGFFPLDGEEHCGITGFEYSLYVMGREWNVPVADLNRESVHPSSLLDYDEKLDSSVRKDLKRVFVGFGNRRLWEQVVQEIDLGVLEDALTAIEENPLLLYRRSNEWNEQRVKMILKLFQRGVRESISSYQPTIRSAVSSAYMFNRPCVWSSLQLGGQKTRTSLMEAVINAKHLIEDGKTVSNKNKEVSSDNGLLFMNEKEYEDFYSYVEDMRQGSTFQEVPYGRHSKVVIPVWGDIHLNETPLLDICKRAFFDLKTVKMANSTFRLLWGECKAKYRFLRDTYEETREACGMDHMQLFDFLNSAKSKMRKVTLQDTTAKSPNIIASLSRIFWPQVKVRSKTLGIEETISNMRHMIMCALSFHFSKKHRLRVVKKIMARSGLKNRDLASCPYRAKKLKVICDFLMTGNRERAMLDIPMVKNGLIGYFIKPQERAKSGQGKVKYSGRGIWVGNVCGIPVRVELYNDHVTCITIQAMQDTTALSKRLFQLVGELGQQAPAIPRKSGSLYYLNPKGHFVVSPLPVSDCICIEVDPEMGAIELNEVKKRNWSVEMDTTTIRLVCHEDIKGGKEQRVTLMSDTYTFRDWSPETTPKDLSWTESTTFWKYCRGEPASLYELIDELGLDVSSSYTTNLLARFDKRDFEVGKFSLSRLRNNLRSYILMSEGNKSSQKQELLRITEEMKQSKYSMAVDDEEIADLLAFGDTAGYDDNPIGDWAEEVERSWGPSNPGEEFLLQDLKDTEVNEEKIQEEDGELVEDLMWSAENRSMEAMAELFFDLDMDDAGISPSDFESLRQMPAENQYWLDVLSVVKSEPHGAEVIKCVLSDMKPTEECYLISHAAFFLSLVLQKNIYSTAVKKDHSETERSLSISTRDPLVAKEDVAHHIGELRKKISDVDNAIAGSSGYVLEILKKKRNELQIQLTSYLQAEEEIYDESVNYYEFMSQLIGKLKAMDIYDKTDYSTDLEVQITLLLSDVLESSIEKNKVKMISDLDLSAVRSRIWDRVFSYSLVKFISNAFNISMTIYNHREVLCENVILMSPVKVELSFNEQESPKTPTIHRQPF